jgi:hypothetical protein
MYCGSPFRPTSSRVAAMHALNAGEGVEVQLQPFLMSAVKRGEWSVSNSDCFIPAGRAACTSRTEEQVLTKDWSVWGREKYRTAAGNQTKISRFMSRIPCLFLQSTYFPTNALGNTTFLTHNKNSYKLRTPKNPTPRPYLRVTWIRTLHHPGSRGRR